MAFRKSGTLGGKGRKGRKAGKSGRRTKRCKGGRRTRRCKGGRRTRRGGDGGIRLNDLTLAADAPALDFLVSHYSYSN